MRSHNRAIGIQPSATLADDIATATPGHQLDAEVLAEYVANLENCTENAWQLLVLQDG
ncbi:hypothetical protein [Vibrio neptunius]|uniref:hypothetical protein n=1 Tax=Vibrio neptunius TaxID=170651 RepID=UPI0019D05382|nr:hypothetical protein [Vibrio neptunius]MBN3572268.1 hypothetical protein [Vibrio neptunius]QXX08535.1 hypothetical protein KW548_23300 [Vibrio neptunius]